MYGLITYLHEALSHTPSIYLTPSSDSHYDERSARVPCPKEAVHHDRSCSRYIYYITIPSFLDCIKR